MTNMIKISVRLTQRDITIMRRLVEAKYYRNISEIVREAINDLIEKYSPLSK